MTELPQLFVQARVARLATVSAAGPHLVPVVFAVVGTDAGPAIATAVDGKPKSTTRLRRLANLAENPRVSLLVDVYDEDWRRLRWVRVDGRAAVHPIDSPLGAAGEAALRAKYPQYETVPLPGPMIVIEPTRVRNWAADGG